MIIFEVWPSRSRCAIRIHVVREATVDLYSMCMRAYTFRKSRSKIFKKKKNRTRIFSIQLINRLRLLIFHFTRRNTRAYHLDHAHYYTHLVGTLCCNTRLGEGDHTHRSFKIRPRKYSCQPYTVIIIYICMYCAVCLSYEVSRYIDTYHTAIYSTCFS